MANVSRGRLAGSGRGQLILVTGLVLAAILVILVLLLNTAIYTENLATRGIDDGSGDAIEFRDVVVTGVGELIDEENAQQYGEYDVVEGAVSDGTAVLSARLSDRYVERGVIADVEMDGTAFESGWLLQQNVSGTFTSKASGDANWTLLEGIDGTRGFTMFVDPSAMAGPSDVANESFAVHVNESGGGDDWVLYVYEDGGNVTLAESDEPGGEPVVRCTVPHAGENVTIDVTGATVAGEECEGLSWPTAFTDYSIGYVNGDDMVGTYRLTVRAPESAEPETFATDAVYGATVDVHYETSTLRFETRVRIAPGEP